MKKNEEDKLWENCPYCGGKLEKGDSKYKGFVLRVCKDCGGKFNIYMRDGK